MFRLLVVMLVVWCCGIGVADAANDRVGNSDVVQMVELGLDDDLIVAKIQSSSTRFDTSATDLKALKDSGVSNKVITAMLSAGASPVAGGNGARQGPEFALLDADGQEVTMSPVRVSVQMSNRKRFIPVYGAFAQPETFMFIQGKEAPQRAAAQSEYLTRVDPLQVRLVHLGLHKSGKRFVVFSANSSDRELEFRSESLDNGWYRLRPSSELTPGEYAFLVSADVPSGMGWWAWFAAYGAQAAKAYDFGVN